MEKGNGNEHTKHPKNMGRNVDIAARLLLDTENTDHCQTSSLGALNRPPTLSNKGTAGKPHSHDDDHRDDHNKSNHNNPQLPCPR